MLFGLCNAPGTIQSMINDVLRDLLDAGTVVYVDDILFYSETDEIAQKIGKGNAQEIKRGQPLCVTG